MASKKNDNIYLKKNLSQVTEPCIRRGWKSFHAVHNSFWGDFWKEKSNGDKRFSISLLVTWILKGKIAVSLQTTKRKFSTIFTWLNTVVFIQVLA